MGRKGLLRLDGKAKTRESPSTMNNPGPIDCPSNAARSQRFYADVRTADRVGTSERGAVVRGVRHRLLLCERTARDDPSLVRETQVRFVGFFRLRPIRFVREPAGSRHRAVILARTPELDVGASCYPGRIALSRHETLQLIEQHPLPWKQFYSRNPKIAPDGAIHFRKRLNAP